MPMLSSSSDAADHPNAASEPGLYSFPVLELIGGKNAFVVPFSGYQQMVDHPGELMSGGRDRLR